MMKQFLFLVGVLTTAALSVIAGKQAPPPTTEKSPVAMLASQVVAPYVQVNAPWSGRGAGTVISLDGEVLVLTAAHVVEGWAGGEDTPELQKTTGTETTRWKAPVVYFSGDEANGGHDLALLRPERTEGLSAAQVASRDDVVVGEPVWYIGTPDSLHARLEASIVAIHDHRLLKHSWNVTNGSGNPGSSGGGLYVLRDGRYVLAGVVTRKYVSVPTGGILVKTPTEILDFLSKYRKHKETK